MIMVTHGPRSFIGSSVPVTARLGGYLWVLEKSGGRERLFVGDDKRLNELKGDEMYGDWESRIIFFDPVEEQEDEYE